MGARRTFGEDPYAVAILTQEQKKAAAAAGGTLAGVSALAIGYWLKNRGKRES